MEDDRRKPGNGAGGARMHPTGRRRSVVGPGRRKGQVHRVEKERGSMQLYANPLYMTARAQAPGAPTPADAVEAEAGAAPGEQAPVCTPQIRGRERWTLRTWSFRGGAGSKPKRRQDRVSPPSAPPPAPRRSVVAQSSQNPLLMATTLPEPDADEGGAAAEGNSQKWMVVRQRDGGLPRSCDAEGEARSSAGTVGEGVTPHDQSPPGGAQARCDVLRRLESRPTPSLMQVKFGHAASWR